MSARDCSGVAHMSALSSSSPTVSQVGSGHGRSNVVEKYSASTQDRCLTSPSRLVPVPVIGRRASYSDSPSSFQTMASRARCR